MSQRAFSNHWKQHLSNEDAIQTINISVDETNENFIMPDIEPDSPNNFESEVNNNEFQFLGN